MSVLKKKGQSAAPPPLEKVVAAPKQVAIAPKQAGKATKPLVADPEAVKQAMLAPKRPEWWLLTTTIPLHPPTAQ
jgi:hypothetical protein